MLGVAGGASGARREDAQRAIVDGVAAGDIDVAAVWGPIGGYFAASAKTPLTVTPIERGARDRGPFAFGIAIGVQRDQEALRDRINAILARRATDLARIVRTFHIPAPQRAATPAKGAP
jgi:ABC-type amino acid transport substrate-binding protein